MANVKNRNYLVAWVSRAYPERRGFLKDIHTFDSAQSLVKLRNKMFPEDFYWVVELPRFERKRLKPSNGDEKGVM